MISIITVAFNNYQTITKPFIEQVLKSKGEFELIVVNNGTEKIPKGKYTLIESKNLGYGTGCNLGYSKAKGDYIIFMNNDVVIKDPNWLKTLTSEADKSVVGPQLVTFNEYTEFMGKCTPYLNGWCVASSRKIWEDIAEEGKVFDENFFLYFEDVEVSQRASLKGYELKEVNCGIEHLVSRSSKNTPVEKYTQESQQYFLNKAMLNYLKATGKKRIVFYFHNSYPFIDSDYEGKGVGGAESAIIQLSREFANLGWLTEVYNGTTKTGVFNGVYYYNEEQFKPWVYTDVFVIFRNPHHVIQYVNAVKKIFWSCDQWTSGYWQKDTFPFVDKVVCISKYHADYVNSVYGPVDKLEVIDLGVKKEDYIEEVEKIPGKLIYCSVPKRGLEYMESLFRKIKQKVPYARLYITSDYTLWGLSWPNNTEFRDQFKDMEGVTFLGKVSREELIKHQKEAEVMAYPCNYEECFCIAAMECIAAGAIPVTTKLAALETTVADSGVLISNMPGTSDYDNNFVEAVANLLADKKKAQVLRNKSRNRALTLYIWEKIAQDWLKLFDSIKVKEMVVCANCNKKYKNGFELSKHKGKAHIAEIQTEQVQAVARPLTQLLKFKRPIECQINGEKFEGTDVEVPVEKVHAVLEICRTAYGADILVI